MSDSKRNTKQSNTNQLDLKQPDLKESKSIEESLLDKGSLSEYIKQVATEREGRSIPPLEKWHPQHSADMDLVIKANGEWWHEGSQINRTALRDLFATVLWMEDSTEGELDSEDSPQYYLKTPVEKLRITVEDVPFLIIDVNLINNGNNDVIEFVTSTGDVIALDDEHPLQMRQYKGENRPYIPVRFGMLGLISRSVLMHLVKLGELSEKNGSTILTLHSNGKAYELSVPN